MNRWTTKLAIDFDKNATDTYRVNLPDTEVIFGRVSDHIARIISVNTDVLVAGPPCQPHSLAGERKASADERDGGADFIEAVSKSKPRQFLMENVPGLLSSEGGRYWHKLYACMEDAGYVCDYRVMDAVSFGVPQFRKRLWIWGIRSDLYAAGIRHCWPKPTHAWPPPDDCMFGASLLPGVTVGQALGVGYGMPTTARTEYPNPTPSLVRGPSDYIKRQPHGHDDEPMCAIAAKTWPIVEYRWSDAMHAKHPPASPAPTVLGKFYKGGAEGLLRIEGASGWSGQRILNESQPGPTVSGGSNQELLDIPESRSLKGLCRRLTPLECGRLQSIPGDFKWPEKISKSAMYKIIGNGWASGMAWAMSQALAVADPESRTVCDLFCGGGLGAVGWHGRYWTLHDQLP